MTIEYKISIIETNQYQNTANYLEKWEQIALKKKETTTPKEKPLFEDAALTCQDIAKKLKEPSKKFFSAVYASLDKEGIIQGIALIKIGNFYSKDPSKTKTYLNLCYLATNPESLRAKGVGSSLMKHLIAQSSQAKLEGIYLESGPTAKTFYQKKFAFKELKHPLNAQDGIKQDGPHPMLLKT